MQDKLIKLCGLYENISKTTGKRYFSGNLSFTSKLLIFQNEDAKEGEPGWTLFVSEREVKPTKPESVPTSEREPKPTPAGDFGGQSGGDYPRRAKKAA